MNLEINKNNILIFDLETGETSQGKLDISKEQLDKSSSILANILLDFVRNGGNINELTPKAVFGKDK